MRIRSIRMRVMISYEESRLLFGVLNGLKVIEK